MFYEQGRDKPRKWVTLLFKGSFFRSVCCNNSETRMQCTNVLCMNSNPKRDVDAFKRSDRYTEGAQLRRRVSWSLKGTFSVFFSASLLLFIRIPVMAPLLTFFKGYWLERRKRLFWPPKKKEKNVSDISKNKTNKNPEKPCILYNVKENLCPNAGHVL